MLNRPLLGLTVVAMLMVQVGCVAFHWRTVKSGNVDFAALFGTAQVVRDGHPPSYDKDSIPLDSEQTERRIEQPGSVTLPVDSLHPPFETLIFLPLTFFPYTT